MKGSGHFLFDPEINKALYTLKNDKDHNVLEHIDDISVVWNTELFAKMELDEKQNNSTNLLEEINFQTGATSANDTNENLLDWSDNEEHKESTNQLDELSDLMFTSNTSENIKNEELIEIEKPKEVIEQSSNLLDFEEENTNQSKQTTSITSNLESISSQNDGLISDSVDQIFSNNPSEQNQNQINTDLIDLNEAPQEAKPDEQSI